MNQLNMVYVNYFYYLTMMKSKSNNHVGLGIIMQELLL